MKSVFVFFLNITVFVNLGRTYPGAWNSGSHQNMEVLITNAARDVLQLESGYSLLEAVILQLERRRRVTNDHCSSFWKNLRQQEDTDSSLTTNICTQRGTMLQRFSTWNPEQCQCLDSIIPEELRCTADTVLFTFDLASYEHLQLRNSQLHLPLSGGSIHQICVGSLGGVVCSHINMATRGHQMENCYPINISPIVRRVLSETDLANDNQLVISVDLRCSPASTSCELLKMHGKPFLLSKIDTEIITDGFEETCQSKHRCFTSKLSELLELLYEQESW